MFATKNGLTGANEEDHVKLVSLIVSSAIVGDVASRAELALRNCIEPVDAVLATVLVASELVAFDVVPDEDRMVAALLSWLPV
ncbi:hypothetical protein A0U92_08105 [Acetobacter aceti]|uniref:Uncharacterized protein n=1 Tax=Acetobacter aceti TaxID=435 RepID=A0A1U9KG95_ACEAC|nr:hypothetical protein A0U92_08105 [Acetobacter aceti]